MIRRLWCSYRGGCDGHRVDLGLPSRRYDSGVYACARCRRLWVSLPSWNHWRTWVSTTAELEWGRDAA